MIYSLFTVRQTAAEELDAALEALDSFGMQGFHYEYPLNQEITLLPTSRSTRNSSFQLRNSPYQHHVRGPHRCRDPGDIRH